MLATWQRRNQVEHDGRVLIWEKTTAAVHFHYCPASISAKTQSVIARLICATTRWACYAHRVGPRWCPPPALSVWPSPSSSPSVCCLTVVMTIVPILSLATHSTTRGKWMRCRRLTGTYRTHMQLLLHCINKRVAYKMTFCLLSLI